MGLDLIENNSESSIVHKGERDNLFKILPMGLKRKQSLIITGNDQIKALLADGEEQALFPMILTGRVRRNGVTLCNISGVERDRVLTIPGDVDGEVLASQ